MLSVRVSSICVCMCVCHLFVCVRVCLVCVCAYAFLSYPDPPSFPHSEATIIWHSAKTQLVCL